MIHIACCSNEKLAPMFGVVVTSIGINVTSDNVMMYLLHNGLKRSTVKRLQKIADRYNVRLKFLKIDLEILKDCPTNDKIHYGNIMMYARLLLSSILPNLDKVIYLDCDLVVCKDLKSLWETDVNDVAVVMVMAPDLLYLRNTKKHPGGGILPFKNMYLSGSYIRYSRISKNRLGKTRRILRGGRVVSNNYQ